MYRYALLVKFMSPAKADPEVICSLHKNMFDPGADPMKKAKGDAFMKQHVEGNTERLDITGMIADF